MHPYYPSTHNESVSLQMNPAEMPVLGELKAFDLLFPIGYLHQSPLLVSCLILPPPLCTVHFSSGLVYLG